MKAALRAQSCLMTDVVLLDSGPLGMSAHPRRHGEVNEWIERLVPGGVSARVSDIADYEVRRELLRMDATAGIRRLDARNPELGSIPVTSEVRRRAALFWNITRRHGRPAADPSALDCDMILAVQAAVLAERGREVIIATTNVRHFSPFAVVREWTEIS